MNRKFLFTICLILVATIGVGCVSAADAHNDTIKERPTFTIEQQNIDQINDQNEIINTEKIIKEDTNTEINNVTEKINSSQTEDTNYTKETPQSININNSTTEPQKSEAQINEDDDEEIEPGNGYTVEQIKKIREYEQFYKEHNYNLRDLVAKIFQDEFPVKFSITLGLNNEIIRTICVIHNEAVIQRGYGPMYSTEEMTKIATGYFWDNLFEMLSMFG